MLCGRSSRGSQRSRSSTSLGMGTWKIRAGFFVLVIATLGMMVSRFLRFWPLLRTPQPRIKFSYSIAAIAALQGNAPGQTGSAGIMEGMTILTASTSEQYAYEIDGGGAGVYTTLLVDALEGAAANLVGDITPGSVYAHIDQSLGPWAQRPVFKTNVKAFISLRRAQPPIPPDDLRSLAQIFPSPGFQFQLDPSFEPERSEEQRRDPAIPPPDRDKNRLFAILQKCVRVNLVRPVDAPHMWHAAMGSKTCCLTVLGEHYRKLIAAGLL